MLGQLPVQLVFKISNLCDHNPPTLQTDRQTDGRHAITIPRFALKCTRGGLGASAWGPAFSWVPQQQNPTYAAGTNQRSIYIALRALTSRGVYSVDTRDTHDSPASHSSSTQLKPGNCAVKTRTHYLPKYRVTA